MFLGKIRAAAKTFTQHIFITLEFFLGNGLANHAAAGAYGFLLSAAPMLLLVSFFLIRAFRAAPESAVALLQSVPFLDAAFDYQWPALDFLIAAPPGLPAVVSLLGLLWAGRIFAVAIQRGLKVVFAGPKRRNPLKDNLVTLAIEFLLLALTLAAMLGSRTAMRLYDAAGFLPEAVLAHFPAGVFGHALFRLAALGLVLYLAYRAIPANPPAKLPALWGSVFCVALYGLVAAALGMMLGQPRYNFIYGALGDLAVALVSVYFFFLCFLLGAQFAAVAGGFDTLFFLRLREARSSPAGKSFDPWRGLFSRADGRLEKYRRTYQKGETVLSKGDDADGVYFLLEGEVEVLLPPGEGPDEASAPSSVGTLKPGSFIGEMGYLLSEERSATIVAKTDAAALELPHAMFGEIVGSDSGLDKAIIENLSRRIKKGNERIAALSGPGRGETT